MKGPCMSEEQTAQDRNARLRQAVAECAAGREVGISMILDTEGRQLLGVAYRILRRQDLAEEALQDAMAQVWRKVKVPGHAEDVLAAAKDMQA